MHGGYFDQMRVKAAAAGGALGFLITLPVAIFNITRHMYDWLAATFLAAPVLVGFCGGYLAGHFSDKKRDMMIGYIEEHERRFGPEQEPEPGFGTPGVVSGYPDSVAEAAYREHVHGWKAEQAGRSDLAAAHYQFALELDPSYHAADLQMRMLQQRTFRQQPQSNRFSPGQPAYPETQAIQYQETRYDPYWRGL